MSETTSTNFSVAQANSSDSAHAGYARFSHLREPASTRRVCFYKSGDPQFNGIKMVVSNRSFKTFDALLDTLSKKVPLPFGVRNISTPRGIHHITSVDELEDGKSYICSHHKKIRPINLERARKKPLVWQSSRPISARRLAVQLAQQKEVAPFQKKNTVVLGSSKKIIILKNGDPEFKHHFILNKKTKQSFDSFLDQVAEALQYPVSKLYSSDGRRILSIRALLLSSGTVVAAGRESFKYANYEPGKEILPVKLPGISSRVHPKLRSKQEMKTPGKWRVSILTSDIPSAGSTSQVYVIFYGNRRASQPIFLSNDKEDVFQSGNEDDFDVTFGDIGEIFKIRIGHNNSGESPSWHLQELQLLNLISNEKLCIKVDRWLSKDQDDGEICREFPVKQHYNTELPVTKYEIHVVTGDLWNAGTEANVFISLHGEYGDTGSRQLLRSSKPSKFVKGQTEVFSLEAVYLGNIDKLIIGHDGFEPGRGWYLEKIIVHDLLKDKEYTFFCYRWLDKGEEDGKIVRQLYVANEGEFPASQELELKRKLIWQAEKWKYQQENTLQFYCRTTKKFIRLTPGCKVDALGNKKDKYGLFDVTKKRGNVCIFSSHQIRNLALAIDSGFVTGMDNTGILCELQVHLQLNRCVLLESMRMPGVTVSFDSDGEPAGGNTGGYAGICKEFVVHVKGIFHSGAVIVLTTSWSQALCIRPGGFCSGAGKQSEDSYWRVHRIGSAMYMFESVLKPRQYLRIQNDQCDGEGMGDEFCHFKVERNLENGSVTLESVRNRGIYVGLLPSGLAKPMVHTGESNFMFYPKVIKYGREKPMGTSATPSLKNEAINKHDNDIKDQEPAALSPSTSPPLSKTKTDDDEEVPQSSKEWKVSVLTGNVGTSADVTLWVYGEKGTTGPIALQKDRKEKTFLPRQEDEFMVEMPKVGKIYKIRIGQNGTGDQPEWKLERITVQRLKNGKTYYFQANRWLSRRRDGCDIVCELPAIENGQPVYPAVKYDVSVYTGLLENAETDAPVYMCIHGDRGDTGKRLLFKSDLPHKFQKGQVDVFEIEAVSLGKLHQVLLGCEANHKSHYWYCEKVIIREQGEKPEYIFNCERWIPFMSQGKLQSEVKLSIQELQSSPKLKEHSKRDEGDWKITVVTGNCHGAGTDATVLLYVYGEKAESGPIILGSGKDQLFGKNSADTFQINLKNLGKMYKIRIGHDNSGEDPDWYLEEVKFQNLLSNRELYLSVNRWLGEGKEDGDTWREVSFPTNGITQLMLLDYEIHVYTGAITNAGTDSNVYINLFGDRGDSGKRKLHKSLNQKVRFQKGQADIFCIQAISLGTLGKIQISHHGTGQGNGWFLEKVFVRYKEDEIKQEVLFPCNRWVNESKQDGTSEIELFPAEKEYLEEHVSKGMRWNIQVKTAKDSSQIKGMKVLLVIYGTQGKSEDILLSPQEQAAKCFLPDTTDEFVVDSVDVGEVYKIRITCNNVPVSIRWHLTSLYMVESKSQQDLTFICNSWFSVDNEGDEAVKEFPAVNKGLEPLPVYTYVVSIHTGDHWGAETDANVYVTLYGEKGDTGVRKLQKSLMPGDMFTRCKTDSFIVEAVSLGELRKVVLEHDGEGYGAGMYLKMVTVKESQDSSSEWIFPFWNWLDSHLAACQTTCELQTTGRRLSRNPEPYKKSGGLWVIDITGSEYSSSGSPAKFMLVFSGDKGKEKLKCKIAGNAIQIKEELKSIGSIYKVQVCWSNLQLKGAWHLMSIHMKHTSTNQEMWLNFDCWMKPNEDKCVELPAMYSIKDPKPVVEYILYFHTGDVKNAGTTGKITICIEGENGDTGRRILDVAGSDLLSLTRGQVDIFRIKAVHLGKLDKITVGFSSPKKDPWFLEKIIVKDEEFSSANYMFSHNEWFVCKSDREFTEAIIPLKEISANVTKVKSFSTTTKGKWQLKVLGTNTGEEKEDLSIVVFGKQGKSPKQKVKNLNYEPFMLNIEGIGEIIKISFLYKTGRKVQLHKVRLKDMDTKQEIGFYIKHISHEDGMESVTELAAVLPNIQPLTDVSYSVNIKTSNFPASDTEADVFITIYGGNGDTCQRKLTPLSYPGVLEKGEVNVFKIKAVDLGMLTKVHIEHKAVGYGAGWFLDQITIEDSQNKGPKYVFPCQQWLDSSIGDKQTSRNLKLLGKVNRTTKRLHKGTVDIFVSTSDVSNGSAKCAVFLTICCEKGNYDPVIFARGSLKQGVTIESSVDLSQNLGAIRKVRLQMEDDASEESWYCKEVLLQHKQTKNRLEFPFCQHFTSDGNNLVAELPALFPDGPISTVKTYTIFITTAQSSKKTTDASMFITLHGNLGDSGQRKFLFKGNVSGKQQGSGFQLEAVDLGVIQELTISQEKQTIFQLEKVLVEEGMLIKKSYVFMAQQWEQKDNKMMAMTLQVTETVEQNNSLAMLNGSNRMASDGEWNICLNEFNKEEHTEPAEYNIVILLYGEKGKSKPFVLKRKEGSQVKGILSYKLNLKYDLGLLYKVRLGLEDEKDRGALSIFYFKMQHTKTMDTFLYSNKTRPLSFDEDRWIEFPVEWPLRSSLSVVKYTVAVFCPDMLSWKDGSYMSVCLHGKNGDTGDRRLAWHNSQGTKDEPLTATLDAVDLGEMHHADISMSSRNDLQIHIQNMHVKESLRNNLYIFEVNNDFKISRNKGEIRKEVLVSQVILNKNADFNQEKPFILDQKKDAEEEQEEHLVKVYTGDARGAGTDANVQIVLIGDQCSSESVQLIHPLEHQNPFERGKVDTFKIATKALGRIQSIDIGHDGKGFGSGWFLDKVEIIHMATNSKIVFMCNRWLAEDENDGRTRITLYS